MGNQANWEKRGITVRYEGVVSAAEIAEFARSTQADPRFTDIRYVLHDFRECTGTVYDASQLHMIAATDLAAALTNPVVRIAVVTDRPDVLDMVRIYLDVGLSNYPLKVFSTVDDARTWLGQLAS